MKNLSDLPALQEINRWMARRTFNTTERRLLYEDLAFLLSNNQKLSTALTTMHSVATDFGQQRENATALCLSDCLHALQSGRSLDVGLSDWVPVSEIALIGAGVTDGDLAGALRRAVEVVKSTAGMKSDCLTALMYPVFLLATMFFMMVLCVQEFIPKLARIAPRESWDGVLWWFATLSEFFVHNGPLLLTLTAAVSIWTLWSLPNFTGPARQWLDRLMPWSIYRELSGVSFLMNLSALMRASLKTLDTLDILARYSSPWLLERIEATRREVNSGAHLGLALKNTQLDFPSRECVNRLVLLTQGDNAESVIDAFARDWLVKTQERVRRQLARLRTVCFGLVGGYLFLVLYAGQQITALAGQMH